LILFALAGLALRLPRTLGRPQSLRIALDIPALLVMAVGFFIVPGVKRPRRNGGGRVEETGTLDVSHVVISATAAT
jgi:hypothetical protein